MNGKKIHWQWWLNNHFVHPITFFFQSRCAFQERKDTTWSTNEWHITIYRYWFKYLIIHISFILLVRITNVPCIWLQITLSIHTITGTVCIAFMGCIATIHNAMGIYITYKCSFPCNVIILCIMHVCINLQIQVCCVCIRHAYTGYI